MVRAVGASNAPLGTEVFANHFHHRYFLVRRHLVHVLACIISSKKSVRTHETLGLLEEEHRARLGTGSISATLLGSSPVGQLDSRQGAVSFEASAPPSRRGWRGSSRRAGQANSNPLGKVFCSEIHSSFTFPPRHEPTRHCH